MMEIVAGQFLKLENFLKKFQYVLDFAVIEPGLTITKS